MAKQAQIEETYDYMDGYFRVALGDHADITGAMYRGDFSLSLESAQAAKHGYIFDELGLRSGNRLLDIGCGWGPVLMAARERGLQAVGLTLSPSQAAACVRDRLDARVLDWQDLDSSTIGRFDGIASVGAFEHFCSKEEALAGDQGKVYRRFFELCGELLPQGRRLYLQTMTWGPNPPPIAAVSLDAPKGSPEYLVALLEKFYPGSYPPLGLEQLEECASDQFRLVSDLNGRNDYIQTMKEWGRAISTPTPRKLLEAARLIPKAISDSDFRWKLVSMFRHGGTNREAFERLILDHHRMVFERI